MAQEKSEKGRTGMVQNRMGKWYSKLMPLFPILILYGFKSVAFLTFSDYMLLAFIMLDIVSHQFKVIYNKTFMPLILYLIFQPVILGAFLSNKIDVIDATGTAWRLALYIFGIALLQKQLIKEQFTRTIRWVGVASALYGFFQFFLGTYFHVSLSPYLPFLPILRTGLKEQQDGWIAYNWTVRPRAWFSEPSTFSIYLLMALLIELFIVQKKNNKLCVVYILGILISHSSTGTIGLIILVLAWAFLLPEEVLYRIPRKAMVALICIMPIGIGILYKSGYIDSFIGHTFANGQGLSSQSHFIDVQAALSEKTSLLQFCIGKGMQDVEAGYLPGWFRTYYCLGMMGVLLYIGTFLRVFRRCSRRARVVVLTFVGLNIGTEIMLGVFMLLYMSAVLLPGGVDEDEWNENVG